MPITRITSPGKKAIDSNENESEKFDGEVADIFKDQARERAVKLLADHKDSSNAAIAAFGTVADAYDKLTTPSFWASMAIQFCEGKKW